ncbi:MAG: DUF6152 family protein [Gammaproteobacteria bacterium]|jgi:hypothetical protein
MQSIRYLLFTCLMTGGSLGYADHDLQDDVHFDTLLQFGGTITGLEWAEPHVLIRITGNPDLQNSPQFLVEIDSSSELAARGLGMSDFEVLSQISIIGYTARSGSSLREKRIHGLYLALSPRHYVLVNERLFNLLPTVEGHNVIIDDSGSTSVFGEPERLHD